MKGRDNRVITLDWGKRYLRQKSYQWSAISRQPSAEKAQRSGGETEKGIKGRINAKG